MDLRGWFLETLADERSVPLRLHERSTAPDGAPQWSRELWRWLTAHPGDVERLVERVPCPHPTTLGVADACALCGGRGSVEATVTRWRWPLWRALRSMRGSQRGRQHLAVLAALASGRAVPDEAATAALRSLRMRWRR